MPYCSRVVLLTTIKLGASFCFSIGKRGFSMLTDRTVLDAGLHVKKYGSFQKGEEHLGEVTYVHHVTLSIDHLLMFQ